jgi:hypothetical protein
MRRRTAVVTAIVLTFLCLSVAGIVQQARTGASAGVSGSVDLAIVRLEPQGDPDGEIECESHAPVTFTYQVSNRGSSPITGLKLGTKCSCEEAGTPPAEIPPGGSAPISFRLRAPHVGKLRRQIPLLIDGAEKPIALFDVSLRVTFEPPALLPPPDGLSMTFVEGDETPRELVFEAIEAQGGQPWICGIELSPSEATDVRPLHIEELSEPDPELTRRRYHFPLVNRSLPLGHQMLMATIQTRDGQPQVKDPVAVVINVADSIAIVPNPLVIHYQDGTPPPPRNVRIVNRSGDRAVASLGNYDHGLLRVEATGGQAGSTAVFDVVVLEVPESSLETNIAFNLGENLTRTLTVQFKPGKRP